MRHDGAMGSCRGHPASAKAAKARSREPLTCTAGHPSNYISVHSGMDSAHGYPSAKYHGRLLQDCAQPLGYLPCWQGGDTSDAIQLSKDIVDSR